jgi:hypothetical protein
MKIMKLFLLLFLRFNLYVRSPRLSLSLGVSTDQSRSILRFLDLSRPTFETCRENLNMSRQAFSNFSIESLNRDLNKNWDLRVIKTVKTLSRFSRHIETRFLKCRDRESRSRPCPDKSRPPGLWKMILDVFASSFIYLSFKIFCKDNHLNISSTK